MPHSAYVSIRDGCWTLLGFCRKACCLGVPQSFSLFAKHPCHFPWFCCRAEVNTRCSANGFFMESLLAPHVWMPGRSSAWDGMNCGWLLSW